MFPSLTGAGGLTRCWTRWRVCGRVSGRGTQVRSARHRACRDPKSSSAARAHGPTTAWSPGAQWIAAAGESSSFDGSPSIGGNYGMGNICLSLGFAHVSSGLSLGHSPQANILV